LHGPVYDRQAVADEDKKMAMEKDNTVKDFDFTDKEVSKTPEEMKIALETVQTLLKEEVNHMSWGGGTKQKPRVDYIDIDWHYTNTNGKSRAVSLVLVANGTWMIEV
jgi:hypothetical protein